MLSLDCLQCLKNVNTVQISTIVYCLVIMMKKVFTSSLHVFFPSIFNPFINSWIYRIGIWWSTDVTESIITFSKTIRVLGGLMTLSLLVVGVRVKCLLLFVLFLKEIHNPSQNRKSRKEILFKENQEKESENIARKQWIIWVKLLKGPNFC